MSLAVLLVALVAGLALQRFGSGARVRDVVWRVFFYAVSPALVLVTFLELHVDRALVLSLAAAVLATWLVAATGLVYARLVARERDEQGALTLCAGWANTGFVGYPLAQLAFGPAGLSLAVLYDRLSWLVPASSISVTIARLFGRRETAPSSARRRLRALLLNPPLLALLAAVVLRSRGVDLPHAGTMRAVSAALVGPFGFLLLGLSLSFEPVVHAADELRRAAGALAIRFAGGPLALLGTGALLGAHVPHVFFLLAAMPPAFNVLVLARVYDVRPALTRLLVVGATLPAVAVVALVSAVR
ncbi:MAG TPA: AEC family transporter [Gaiellaceae bacterium]